MEGVGGTGLAYGIQLPVQAQSTYFVEDWEREAGTAELAAVAQAADESGYLYVAVCDHVAVPRPLASSMSTTWYDPIATLSFLAGITTTVRLLSHVYVLPYRHPLLAAKSFATLDALSGGRAIVGVGAGHAAGEFAALGVDFHRRGRLLDEGIDALAAALADEWAAGDVGQRPRPVQQPRPPIWVGGSSPAAIERAAAKGDGWLPQGTPKADMPAQIDALLAHRRACRGDEPIVVGAITPFLYVGEPGWDTGKGCLAGDPDRIASYLLDYAAMGVHQVQVRFRSRSADELCDQVRAFGAAVGPLLADGASA
jgi:probable F420-dependent oxidoreductase